MRKAQASSAGTCATSFRVDSHSLIFLANLTVIQLTQIGGVLQSHVLPDRTCSIWSVGNDTLDLEPFQFPSQCVLHFPGVANVDTTDCSGDFSNFEQNPVPSPGHTAFPALVWHSDNSSLQHAFRHLAA